MPQAGDAMPPRIQGMPVEPALLGQAIRAGLRLRRREPPDGMPATVAKRLSVRERARVPKVLMAEITLARFG